MSESANPAGVSSAVIFRSAGGLFAVPMQDVIEINSRTDLTPLPCLPDYILGVINLMGSVTPVIDLRRRLDFEDCEYGPRSCLMVLRHGEESAAIKVDEVLTSKRYLPESFLPLPDPKSVIAGYITDGGEEIQLIRTEMLFEKK